MKTVTLLRKCHTVNDSHLYVLFCIKHSCTLVKQSAQCHNFFVNNYKDTNFVCDMYVCINMWEIKYAKTKQNSNNNNNNNSNNDKNEIKN